MSKTPFPLVKVPRNPLPPLFPFSCVQKRRANIEEDIQEPSSSTLRFPVCNGGEREGGRIVKNSTSSSHFSPCKGVKSEGSRRSPRLTQFFLFHRLGSEE
jgi:hypothetical protein